MVRSLCLSLVYLTSVSLAGVFDLCVSRWHIQSLYLSLVYLTSVSLAGVFDLCVSRWHIRSLYLSLMYSISVSPAGVFDLCVSCRRIRSRSHQTVNRKYWDCYETQQSKLCGAHWSYFNLPEMNCRAEIWSQRFSTIQYVMNHLFQPCVSTILWDFEFVYFLNRDLPSDYSYCPSQRVEPIMIAIRWLA